MKNLIITHNEIQSNLFFAVTGGMQAMFDGKYAINGESKEREYEWKVTRSDKMESSALLPPLYYYQINKGAYEMNDIRIGVTSAYIRDHAKQFMADFRKFLNGSVS